MARLNVRLNVARTVARTVVLNVARTRGYSLIELAVAMTIAAIVAAVAVSVYAGLAGSMFGLRAQSRLDTQLQRVGRVLAGDLQEVGGGAVRPWHAMFLQPTPGKPDRLLMLTAEIASRPCTVTEYEVHDGELTLDPSCRACAAEIPESGQTDYVGRFAVVSMPGTGEGRVVVLRERHEGSCRFRAAPFVDASDADHADHDHWRGADLTVVDARWTFVDEDTHELKAWLLYDGDHAPAGATAPTPAYAPRAVLTRYVVDERLLASQVYDFQVALGYDVDYDNVVHEVVGGVDDEWFGNARGEVPAGQQWIGDASSEFTSAAVFTPDHGVQQIRLRSAALGLVMGAVARNGVRDAVHVLDGADFRDDGVYYRGTVVRAVFRNAGVAQ